VDVAFLDFGKAFATVSHSILLERLAAHGLGVRTVCLVKKLTGWLGPKSGGEWSSIQLSDGHKWYSPGFSVGATSV